MRYTVLVYLAIEAEKAVEQYAAQAVEDVVHMFLPASMQDGKLGHFSGLHN